MHSKLKDLENMKTPGPGQYESPLKAKRAAPAYKMGTEKRTQSQVGHASPPPNAYNPTTDSVQKQGAAWGFGSEKRGTTANPSFAPGPGNCNRKVSCCV